MTSKAKRKVAVVGAGAAGLAATRYLADNSDFDVVCLEANPERYGGRIWTFRGVPGFEDVPCELGAMWIHYGDDERHPFIKICRENHLPVAVHDFGTNLGVHGYPQKKLFSDQEILDKFKDWQAILGEVSDHYFADSELADCSILQALATLKPEYREKLQSDPYMKYPGNRWLIGHYGSRSRELSAKMFGERFPTPEESQAEGRDVFCLSGYSAVLDKIVSGGRKPLNIMLNRKVTKVKFDPHTAQVTLSVGPNPKETMVVDHVIITVSLGVMKAKAIDFEPTLPIAHVQAIDRMGFGNYVKFFFLFDRVFWPIDKDWIIMATDPPGFLHCFVNLYRHHGMPAIICHAVGDMSYLADSLSDEVIIEEALKRFRMCFAEAKDATVKYFKRSSWRKDPLVRGAFAFKQVGMTMDDCRNIQKPVPPYLFFAGEHTMATEGWDGYAHGAYLSGIRAAKEVIGAAAAAKARL